MLHSVLAGMACRDPGWCFTHTGPLHGNVDCKATVAQNKSAERTEVQSALPAEMLPVMPFM
jgi:hypothetical protein